MIRIYQKGLFILAVLLAVNYSEAQNITDLLRRHASPSAVPVLSLSNEIHRLAKLYDVPELLIARVLLQESRGVEWAFNEKSADNGLMQINTGTADFLGLDFDCLYNWKCNLEAGVRILATVKHKPCLYNVGLRGLKSLKGRQKCFAYEQKLEAIK